MTGILIIRVDISKKKFLKFFFFDWIDYPTDKHIDGNTDNKGRKKNKFFEKNIFFSPLNRLPNRQTNYSTEILIIRVERKKKHFEIFFSTIAP